MFQIMALKQLPSFKSISDFIKPSKSHKYGVLEKKFEDQLAFLIRDPQKDVGSSSHYMTHQPLTTGFGSGLNCSTIQETLKEHVLYHALS